MAFINLASGRHRSRATAEKFITRWELDGKAPPKPYYAALYALLANDAELFARAANLSRALFDRYSGVSPKELVEPGTLAGAVGLAVVEELDGRPCTELWEKIAAAPTPRAATDRALQRLGAEIAGVAPGGRPRRPLAPGTIGGESDWVAALSVGEPGALFDRATCPDHPSWVSLLDPFVLPLCLLLARGDRRDDLLGDALARFARGSDPERHPRVVYERTRERPGWDVTVQAEDPATWPGFDAVELCDDGSLRAYFYMGIGWEAPLLFDDNVDAFWFLQARELGWKLVADSVHPTERDRVADAARADRVVYVAVYDERVAAAPTSDLQRAATHYQVELEAKDLMEV